MERPTCKTCPYFNPHEGEVFERDGECRKYAMRAGIDMYQAGTMSWPEVWNDDWCGDHWDFWAYAANLKKVGPLPTAPSGKPDLG